MPATRGLTCLAIPSALPIARFFRTERPSPHHLLILAQAIVNAANGVPDVVARLLRNVAEGRFRGSLRNFGGVLHLILDKVILELTQ